MDQIENIEITNPNKAWVVAEFGKLFDEWVAWEKDVQAIVDQPYDQNEQSEVYADGEDMMLKHTILQTKTLTFLNNNIKGHGFIRGFDGRHIDRTDLRLAIRVKHRMRDLRVLQACLEYAKVPEAFWRQKGRELVEKVLSKGSDAAVDIATSYLKNPMGGGQ